MDCLYAADDYPPFIAATQSTSSVEASAQLTVVSARAVDAW